MAKFEILIPFILHSETGLKSKYLEGTCSEMFERARKSGFANDPADSGGPTMCGVTLATYRAYRTAHSCATTTVEDLKNITFDEWQEIMRLMFWNRWKADQITSQPVANALVDWVWMSGSYGITTVQRMLHLRVDGIVGPRTLATINNYPDQHALFDRIQRARHNYHKRLVAANPAKSKFMKGWRNRVNKITWEGFKYE